MVEIRLRIRCFVCLCIFHSVAVFFFRVHIYIGADLCQENKQTTKHTDMKTFPNTIRTTAIAGLFSMASLLFFFTTRF